MKLKLLSTFALGITLACAEPAGENLRETFFSRSIGSISTTSYFVEAKVFDEEKNGFEKRFLNAANFRNALILEHGFSEESFAFPGWLEAVEFAIQQRDEGFIFAKEGAFELVQQRFTRESLIECREKVAAAGLEKVQFYLTGLGRGVREEAEAWFQDKGIDSSTNGPLPQILYEFGYFPYESQGHLQFLTRRQYKESLGEHYPLMVELGVLKPQTEKVVQDVIVNDGAGPRRD